ncbi:MAG: HAMP domain-containing histidine kinase [Lachnospiraceae bacterium]|nr:HAMP domain-containing histidine kinase [Lachnospiraceae bacterium]
MKFKTRILVTFMAIVLLPLCLTILAFTAIGGYFMHKEANFQLNADPTRYSYQMLDYYESTQNVFEELKRNLYEDPSKAEDAEFLDSINEQLATANSSLILRKNGETVYIGDQADYQLVADDLPDFSGQEASENRSYYLGEDQKLVKQLDFHFADGSEGTAYVITQANTLINQSFLKSMMLSIVVILVVTSLVISKWFVDTMVKPVQELNKAMQEVKDGNFEYRISDKELVQRNEIGELYRSYEDMRLRLKENADEKIRQENQNRELISNITHDLKTPMTSIKGYVEGIMDGVADTPEKMQKYIKTIYTKACEMDKLINELTLYAGIDSHRIPYTFHRINVASYFDDCVEEVGMDLENKGIKLNYTNTVDRDTRIIADPEQLKRVVNNIISNSVKYMDNDQGEIDIRVLDEVDSVRVEIEDNGKGIAQKDLGRIFERFYRTDASRNSMKGGSGIGLSIVKKIIEDHGGYIWATSKEGEGTCMHFVLRKYTEQTETGSNEV